MAVVLQILSGQTIAFIGGNMVGNFTALVGELGNHGLVSLISVGIILYLFQKNPSHSTA